jgi:hypothetical protein
VRALQGIYKFQYYMTALQVYYHLTFV